MCDLLYNVDRDIKSEFEDGLGIHSCCSSGVYVDVAINILKKSLRSTKLKEAKAGTPDSI